MKVGFIGLGAMGFPMAQRVIKAGFPLITTFHRRREPADALASLGAKVVRTPAEVASEADVIVTILPADLELEQTILGAEGVLEAMAPGKVLVEMTTGTAMSLLKIEKAVEAAGAHVLDAPVSGGTSGAMAGTLTIMVGGTLELLEQVRPVLSAMGNRIIHVGGSGQGKTIKMINQMMAAIHLLAIGEAFALGIRCGADPNTMYDVIKDSSGYSRMMDLRLRDFLLAGFFEPGFKLDLMKKDVQLALDSARAKGAPALLTSLTAQIFAAASAAGYGNDDFSRAADFLAAIGKVSLSEATPAADSARAQ
jgi:3-hydroxyisobutyrate dehydrogenase-like beta-hydroxyacid dehydrogenase